MPEFLQLMENWDGYKPLASHRLNEAALARFVDLTTNRARMPQHRWEYLMRETVTTADFPNLFGGVLDRTLLARYRAVSSPWRQYVKIGRARDFRARTAFKVQGQDTLLPAVPEKTEYPQLASVQGSYTIPAPIKYGRSFDISWEALLNDFLDAFGDLPARFADAALNTEAIAATSLYSGAAAPNAALFGAPVVDAADGANVTNLGVLPLSINNLGITMALMAAQTDVNGHPLGIRGVHLVVPPALEITARQILTSALMQHVDVIGGANAAPPAYIPLPTANVLPQMGLRLHVDPWIPVVMPVAAANRTWFLFADTNQGAWGQIDFLAGHETPEIAIKSSNKMLAGGGLVSPLEGDFESDNVMYRVRHVLGSVVLDPRYAYAQVGP